MGSRFSSATKKRIFCKGLAGLIVFLFMAGVLFTNPARALDFKLFDRPLMVNGYINQGVSFGVAGDSYSTRSGFQQALMQVLLELDYQYTDDFKVFVTGQLNKDWAYDIYNSDNDWGNDQPPNDPVGRRFKESRSELSLYSDYEDILKECHVTWTPGNFNLRVGKQIVAWGRMDGVRIMDQINPRDGRRGMSDVEFETSIIPIWLAKLEYFPETLPDFLMDLGLEFTFNPNADFIGNKSVSTGNDVYGIWSADVLQAFGPLGYGRIWSAILDIEEPESWNSEGFEYAFRFKGTLPDNTYFTLNYFDGVSNSPVTMSSGTPTGVLRNTSGNWVSNQWIPMNGLQLVDDKGRQLWQPYLSGEYFDQRYAGLTFSREFESLYINALGGQAPLIRCEGVYEFDTTFGTSGKSGGDMFEEYDAIYWGMGVDWKFKWSLLNPRRYFVLVPQFSHRHIRDYPSDYTLAQHTENTYAFSIRMSTQYLHDKLEPFAYYMRTIKGSVKSDLWIRKLTYSPNEVWKFSSALYLVSGEGYDAVDHQDNLSFTVSYQF